MDVLTRLIPNELQEKRIQQVVNEPTKATLIASEMGTGKTLIAVESIVRIAPTKPVLIVAPLSTFISWERTLIRQGLDIPVFRIDTTKAGKEAYESLSDGIHGVYIIGHALFRTKKWNHIKLSILVYDEVHDVSNRQSKGHQVLMTTRSEWRIALSGTPARNKFQNFWAVTRWLWRDTIDRSFWRWAAEYCFIGYDVFAGKVAEGERESGKFVSTLPLYIRDKLSLDTGYVEEVRHVELTASQRKIYDQMEKHGLMWLEEHVAVASLPIVQRIRLRQVTLGVPTVTEGTKRVRDEETGEMRDEPVDIVSFKPDCKSSKIDAAKEILAAHEDENFLILLDSAKFAKIVADRLGESARLWSGEVGQDMRKKLLVDFGTSFRILVATIPTIGTGTDGLQEVCNHVIIMSESEDGVLNEQARGRLHRTGQTATVKAWNIQGVNTLDSGQYSSLRLREIEMQRSLA